jgi:hypothetical protein
MNPALVQLLCTGSSFEPSPGVSGRVGDKFNQRIWWREAGEQLMSKHTSFYLSMAQSDAVATADTIGYHRISPTLRHEDPYFNS